MPDRDDVAAFLVGLTFGFVAGGLFSVGVLWWQLR